jgi:hypothetical protein
VISGQKKIFRFNVRAFTPTRKLTPAAGTCRNIVSNLEDLEGRSLSRNNDQIVNPFPSIKIDLANGAPKVSPD